MACISCYSENCPGGRDVTKCLAYQHRVRAGLAALNAAADRQKNEPWDEPFPFAPYPPPQTMTSAEFDRAWGDD